MAGEQFSLCWDNFHKNMSSGMHSLLESEDLVDVTLAVEGKYLKAHKMVLSVCSPYFRELFQSNPCQHPIVFMKDVSYLALSDLLTFMYQGEVQVNQEHLATFIKTAEALQIKGLTGDGSGDGSDNVDESQSEETTKRTIHEVEEVQVPRPKKPPSYPIKRPKPNPTNSTTPEAKIPKTEVVSLPSAPSAEQIIQFKMEPYEGGDQSSVENVDDSQVDHFIDESADDTHMEDTEDYSMLEGEEEPQAGTSGDGLGDSQGGDLLPERPVVKKRPYVGIVVDGFVYHQNSVKTNSKIRYLVCSEYKRLICRARATLPINGTSEDLVLTRGHNHPPVKDVEEKDLFIRSLKELVRSSPEFPLKQAYDTIQILYLGCVEIKKSGCRGRATIPVGGTFEQLKVTQPHNHPPDVHAEEKDAFTGELKRAVRQMGNATLKQVYENVAEIYPQGAKEISFRSICSSLHRWRRNPNM